LLAALRAELAIADEDAKRELAEQLRPYLSHESDCLLDAVEAGPLAKLHPETLVRFAREGRVWAVKVGREWRFRADRLAIGPPAAETAPSTPRPPVRRRAAGRGRASIRAA